METRGDRHVFNPKRCRASSFHRTAAMHHKTRAKLVDLNEHFICALCGGYLIDATTITECLHSFCKTCIIRYLESCNYCPICDAHVHKTRPQHYLRQDRTLQDLVYKLVPGLFKEEMKRRCEFYEKHPIEGAVIKTPENDVKTEMEDPNLQEQVVFSEDEKISLSLQLSTNGRPPTYNRSTEQKRSNSEQRYLLCPAALTIGHLKKFIRLKFNLYHKFKVDIYHSDECLSDAYTLMDIAYIYTWRRRFPMKLFFTVYESIKLKRKSTVEALSSPPKFSKEARCNQESDNTSFSEKINDTEQTSWTTKSLLRNDKVVPKNSNESIVVDMESSIRDQSPFRDVAIPVVATTPPPETSLQLNPHENSGNRIESLPSSPLDISRNDDVTKASQTDVKMEPLELVTRTCAITN